MTKVCQEKFIVLFLFLSSFLGYSQASKRIILECKSELLKPGQHPLPLNFSSTSSVKPIATYFPFYSTQSEKKPVFCRMEDNLYKRFNVWIVMRAGSDEEYKKLIEEKNKPNHENTP